MLLGFPRLSKNIAMTVAILATVSTCFLPREASAASSKTRSASVAQTLSAAPQAPSVAPQTNEFDETLSDSTSAPAAAFTNPFSTQDDSKIGYSRGESKASIGDKNSWRLAKETKFAYKFGSGFESFANEREQSQYFGFRIGADSSVRLLEALKFRARGSADVTTGYAQSRFGDNVGRSGIYLQDAVLTLRALDTEPVRLYLAGGALDQGAFDAPLFIARQPFPGAKETLFFGNSKAFQLKVWAQQTIPTSKTLSTKTVDAEVTPSLFTETVEMNLHPFEALRTTAAITHFTFNNLPSAIAQESIIYGNTVEEVGPNTSRFKYRFEGLIARGEFHVQFTPGFALNCEGYVIQNAAAPEGFRNAQFLRGGFEIGLPNDVILHTNLMSFFVEDDAVPGFYNSSFMGHNNRKGMGASARAMFQKQRFQIKAEYADAETINYNINQSRQQTLTIGFETFYEML